MLAEAVCLLLPSRLGRLNKRASFLHQLRTMLIRLFGAHRQLKLVVIEVIAHNFHELFWKSIVDVCRNVAQALL